MKRVYSDAMPLCLFAALPLPDGIAEHLSGLQLGVPGAIWRQKEVLHLTLRFFGNVTHEAAEGLDHELARIHCKPFDLAIQGAGHFGREEPRALWMGIEAHSSLLLLSKACERAALRAGLNIEKRSFIPHITLAYLHETSLSHVQAFERRHALFRSPDWRADRFYLYSSWKGGRGDNPYRIEAEYPLA